MIGLVEPHGGQVNKRPTKQYLSTNSLYTEDSRHGLLDTSEDGFGTSF